MTLHIETSAPSEMSMPPVRITMVAPMLTQTVMALVFKKLVIIEGFQALFVTKLLITSTSPSSRSEGNADQCSMRLAIFSLEFMPSPPFRQSVWPR